LDRGLRRRQSPVKIILSLVRGAYLVIWHNDNTKIVLTLHLVLTTSHPHIATVQYSSARIPLETLKVNT